MSLLRRVARHVWCIGGLLLVGGLGASPVVGQGVTQLDQTLYQVTYRPTEAQYHTVPGTHFDLIFQDGTADTAWRVRRALRQSRAGSDSLVRGTPRPVEMPVVVDGFSDRSNGFVTPFPFKQEIEAPSIRDDALVARSSSWPAIVGPHELVHALHGEIDTGGLGGLLRFFAPDAARALNLTAPLGLTEGIAVYRESRLDEGAGRLNAPLFTMKMRAAMLSDEPWSLTQMLEPPSYTQPFNRYYIGGAHAFEVWAERGNGTSTAFFQKASALHSRFPFFGYGVGLWHGLGQWPGALNDTLRSTLQDRFRRRVERRAPFTDRERIVGRTGHNYRRPYWIDEDTLVAYLHGYDVRRGFYRINADTGGRSPIRVQSITEDYTYSLGRDTSALYASRYVPDPWVPSQEVAEVERVDLETGKSEQLTEGGRGFAPVEAPNGDLWAIQNDAAFTQWARQEGQRLRPLTTFERARFKQIAPSPQGRRVAVLLNVDGSQRLYRIDHRQPNAVRVRPWLGLKEATIYDICWGPQGRYLLFSADLTGVPNVYAFDTNTNEVRRLTNVPYGALEPTLSPDRSTVAFVEYQHERHELVRIPFRPTQAPTVSASQVVLGREEPRPPARRSAATTTDTTTFSESRPYAAWRHLEPRMVYPTIAYDADEADLSGAPRYERLGVGIGVGVAGNDPLGRWRYRGNAYWQDGRPWGTATVQTGRSRLRPSLTVFNTPETVTTRLPTSQGRSARFGFEERGVSLGTRVPMRIQSNVYQTVAALSLGAEFRQTRFFGDALEVLGAEQAATLREWRNRVTLSPQGVFGYRVQQNPRDLVPNQGLVVRANAEVDAWTDEESSSHAFVAEANVYLPLALRSHTGVRLGAGVLTQNDGAVVGTQKFVPRGYEDRSTGAGTFLRLGTEVTQPLWYIDDGSTLVPFYAKALYGYGFGQTLTSITQKEPTFTSVGGGLGLQFRFFYVLDLNLRVGAAFRVQPGDIEAVWR